MSDLIDRAEAVERLLALTVYKSKRELIEAVEKSVSNENGWVGGVAECIDEIEDMPDAPLPAAPRWVRCEEELPRKTRKFVVWVPVNNGPYPCWYEERTALWQAVEKKWYVDHNPKTWWVGEPTHWMPIEPPKEDA